MAGEKERVDGYLATIERLEPDIRPIDLPAAAASIAISLKRIADFLERFKPLADVMEAELAKAQLLTKGTHTNRT